MDELPRYGSTPRPPAIHAIETEARKIFPDENQLFADVQHYWRTIRRHWRIVAGVTVAALILTTIRLMEQTPIYTAETTILIEPEAAQGSDTLESLVEIEAAAANADEYYKTQCAILQSHDLAASVVRQLGLASNAIFSGHRGHDGSTHPAEASGVEPAATPGTMDDAPPITADAPAGVVRAYLGMLKVAPVSDTNLVKISFATPDPHLSAELANAHVAAYGRRQIEMRGNQSEEAQRFLRDKLAGIKDQLQKSEAALNDYRRQKGIIPGLISVDGKDAVVLDRLADLSKDLTHAQVERIGLEAQVHQIDQHDYKSLPEASGNAAIQDLEKQLNELYGEAAALSSQFKPDYPPLAKLQARISAVEARLQSAIKQVTGGIQAQYREAVERESELQAEVQRQRAETLQLNDAAAEYAILQREVDTNRELYNAILTRIKNVAVQSGLEHSNVSLINSAEAPTVPTSPRKGRDLMLALMLGLAGGVGLSFGLEFFDNTLKNPEDAESYLRLPILGVVPDFARLSGIKSPYLTRELTNGRMLALPAGRRELVTHHGSYSPLGEAYRNLRTTLLLSRAGAPPRTILLTSATSREGKTVTSVNVAVMLAQLGGPTLLVDADLRRARCHRVLELDNHVGLTEVLTGVCTPQQATRRTSTENLDFLGAGCAPPNPTELLGSAKMAETLELLGKFYRYIVVDSSPVLPVSDALLLARFADGIVVIANAPVTPRQQVNAACLRLKYAQGKILGVVLNRIRPRSPEYHAYYHNDYYSVRSDSTPDLDDLD